MSALSYQAGSRLATVVWCLLLAQVPGTTRGDDAPLSLADLPSYRRALESAPDLAANSVTFRDLWDRSSELQGRRVQVEGTVERVFRQPAIGQLPALAEAWIFTSSRDPICLVFPDAELTPGSLVSFSGDYLKRLRYGAGDTARLAPLIVGPRPPVLVTKPSSATIGTQAGSRGLEWIMKCVVLMMIAGGFVRVLVRRPRSRPLPNIEPDPVFQDGPRPV